MDTKTNLRIIVVRSTDHGWVWMCPCCGGHLRDFHTPAQAGDSARRHAAVEHWKPTDDEIEEWLI